MSETIEPERMPAPEELYLGDGLYMSFDGESVKLRTPRLDGDHEVYLDQEVLRSFLHQLPRLGIQVNQ